MAQKGGTIKSMTTVVSGGWKSPKNSASGVGSTNFNANAGIKPAQKGPMLKGIKSTSARLKTTGKSGANRGNPDK